MNKHLVLLAAVSMLFSACGNSEEPKISQPATGAQRRCRSRKRRLRR
jgi:hypothetical protein